MVIQPTKSGQHQGLVRDLIADIVEDIDQGLQAASAIGDKEIALYHVLKLRL